MISENELRIGNWITYPNSNPFQITRDNVLNNDFWDDVEENIEPIPLTPDIVEKCGFENKNREYHHSNFYPTCYFENELFFVEFGEYRISKKHLHQLQNLYFDLTGEELNVQLRYHFMEKQFTEIRTIYKLEMNFTKYNHLIKSIRSKVICRNALSEKRCQTEDIE